MQGQDQVRSGLEFEADIFGEVKPGRVLGPDVHDALLAVADGAVLVLGHVEGLGAACPDFFVGHS